MLSVKQSRFIDEYLVSLNGAQAVRAAGYSERSARQIAVQLLSKHYIQAEVERRCNETERRLQISRDDVIKGLIAAFQEARDQKQPMAMIAAMREIAKMMGYYNPVLERKKLSEKQSELKRQIESMTDGELLAIVRGGGQEHD